MDNKKNAGLKNWKAPEIDVLNISETQNSNQPDNDPDGVFLGWLDKEGTECDTCS